MLPYRAGGKAVAVPHKPMTLHEIRTRVSHDRHLDYKTTTLENIGYRFSTADTIVIPPLAGENPMPDYLRATPNFVTLWSPQGHVHALARMWEQNSPVEEIRLTEQPTDTIIKLMIECSRNAQQLDEAPGGIGFNRDPALLIPPRPMNLTEAEIFLKNRRDLLADFRERAIAVTAQNIFPLRFHERRVTADGWRILYPGRAAHANFSVEQDPMNALAHRLVITPTPTELNPKPDIEHVFISGRIDFKQAQKIADDMVDRRRLGLKEPDWFPEQTADDVEFMLDTVFGRAPKPPKKSLLRTSHLDAAKDAATVLAERGLQPHDGKPVGILSIPANRLAHARA